MLETALSHVDTDALGSLGSSSGRSENTLEPTPSVLERDLGWEHRTVILVLKSGAARTIIEGTDAALRWPTVAWATLRKFHQYTSFLIPHHGTKGAAVDHLDDEHSSNYSNTTVRRLTELVHEDIKRTNVTLVTHSDADHIISLNADFLFLASVDPSIQTKLATIFHQDVNPGTIDPFIRFEFLRLSAEWRKNRSATEPGFTMFLRPEYQKIIGLGMTVVPLILRELERELDHWFWALAAITREDPVPPEFKGNLPKMRNAWLNWGRQQGYLW